MSAVAPADDDTSSSSLPDGDDNNSDTSSSSSSFHAERLLPNGDFYTGHWCGALPDGTGKYLWTDGSMYEGDWRHGKTTGRGKFSWPSGATYEGEFKSGFMDGFGTYTGSSGDTYRGLWAMNLKDGPGKKCYLNGDYYDGEWRAGLQHGHGRYVWRNGSEYIGHWRNGLIHGRGCLVWCNGNRYDGGWDDGAPRGSGSFRWADGSLYVGLWTPGGDPKGVYYPSPAAASPTARDPQEAFAADLIDCKICPGETVPVLPSQKPLHWSDAGDDSSLYKQSVLRSSKGASDPTGARPRRRGSLDAPGAQPAARRPNGRCNTVIGIDSGEKVYAWENDVPVGGETKDTNEAPEEEEPRSGKTQQQQARWSPMEMKKQGITISKGHKNYELMLNLQLGIRHAVGKQQGLSSTSLDLKSSAFDPREKVWTKFPPEGSKHTPPHQSCEFRWKDYCPLVFRTLRRLFQVDAADYMISICGNDALRELSSPGKSGSFFYLTNDDRYMIKTMKKAEVKVLLRMLPAYYKHVRGFENTLVTKFFGLHCVKLTGAAQKKVRFVIMGNLFCSVYPIHRRFDLKGSSHGRTTDKPEAEIDGTTTLKDLDLNFIFRLQRSWFQDFHRQVDKDCEFLEHERIMDYSLLVGLHFRDTRDMLSNEGNGDSDSTKETTPRLSTAGKDQFLTDLSRWSPRLGMNMPAMVEQTARRSNCDSGSIGESTGDLYEVVLFFGIIDILQDYDISKKLEHAYKSMHYDPASISAVDPKLYSKRFREFIYKVFVEGT